MMKTLFFTIVGFLCFSTVVAAELSVEDLEKIRKIVNEAEVRLEKRITETEVRLEKRITEIEGHLEKRIADQSKRLDFHATLIITLIGALIAFVGVPLVLIAYQQNRRTQQDDTIKAQATEIQALREKIESLEKMLS
jgi:Skp family chaperone for outer membrane proteins